MAACEQAAPRRSAALNAFDFRAATAAVWDIVGEANRYIERVRPWELARAGRGGRAGADVQLDVALWLLIKACRTLGRELAPFVPALAARITESCDDSAGSLAPARPLFPRINWPDHASRPDEAAFHDHGDLVVRGPHQIATIMGRPIAGERAGGVRGLAAGRAGRREAGRREAGRREARRAGRAAVGRLAA